MKIQGPKQTSGAGSVKKSSKSGSSDAAGFDGFMSAGKATGAGATAAPQSMTAVDALLAVQSVEDPTERAARKRMTLRADNILEELDGLHLAMLGGKVSMAHMVGIADIVAGHKERVVDKTLSNLLDEIDLRAQVELAKMRKALDKSS